MITKPHYHLATGKDSKNSGNLYKCPSRVCCIEPAYTDDRASDEIPL